MKTMVQERRDMQDNWIEDSFVFKKLAEALIKVYSRVYT